MRVKPPEAKIAAPYWWTDDDDASDSSMQAFEMMRNGG